MMKMYKVAKIDKDYSLLNRVITNIDSEYVSVNGVIFRNINKNNDNMLNTTSYVRNYMRLTLDEEVNVKRAEFFKEPARYVQIKMIKGFISHIVSRSFIEGIPIYENMNYSYMKDCHFTVISTDGNCIDENTVISEEEFEETKNVFKAEFDYMSLGVGGLSSQINQFIRDIIVPRMIPDDIKKSFDVKNVVRGMLIYGPPGCGKTLLAKSLVDNLECEVKIVLGPEIISSYIGKSEENIRLLFQPARDNPKKLHILMFDEFDAISKKRGGNAGVSSNINDNIINQLLSIIDGPDALDNILIIGMTNNEHVIDPALLRPGRISLQMFVGLPDKQGREEIFKINLARVDDKHKYLSIDSDISEFAELTNNFTGAEVKDVIVKAKALAMSKHIDPNNLLEKSDFQDVCFVKDDFLKAISMITPQFGKGDDVYETLLKRIKDDGYDKLDLKYGKVNALIVDNIDKAVLIADKEEFNFVKYVHTEMLLESQTYAIGLREIFQQAKKSITSTVILDNFENILEFSKVGNQFNNKTLQVIKSFLTSIVGENNRITVIAVCKDEYMISLLELNEIFDYC